MKKPLKESWLSYYVATPLRSVLCSLKECLETTAIKLKGGWYCEYCHKTHCRRVYKYKLLLTADSSAYAAQTGTLRPTHEESGRWVCRLGKYAIVEEGWKPKYVTRSKEVCSMLNGHRDVKLLFRCDPAKNTQCKKTMCYLDGPDSCICTTNPEFSTDGKILWPAFTVEPGRRVGCESCPLGSDACASFRRGTPCGECPCDVYDTYTDYIKAEEEAD